MEFRDLLEYCQAQAILHTLVVSELSTWRSVCRSYSKKFATPLHLCLDGTIPPEDILLAEFEDQLDEIDLDKDLELILDRIYSIENPEYEREKKRDLEDFIVQAEAEEEERVKSGKPIHRLMKEEVSLKSLPETPASAPTKLPTQGGVDFSRLPDEEG